jgi:hypothetical protein
VAASHYFFTNAGVNGVLEALPEWADNQQKE